LVAQDSGTLVSLERNNVKSPLESSIVKGAWEERLSLLKMLAECR